MECFLKKWWGWSLESKWEGSELNKDLTKLPLKLPYSPGLSDSRWLPRVKGGGPVPLFGVHNTQARQQQFISKKKMQWQLLR